VSTFVLIPGAGSGPDLWSHVEPLLQAAGHETVAPDLPNETDSAGLREYTDCALEAIGEREDLIVVGMSIGAFTAAAIAAERETKLLVFLNGMIPVEGETPGRWFGNVNHDEAAAETLEKHGPMGSWTEPDFAEVFLHDVPPESLVGVTERVQGLGIFGSPLTRWPAGVPVRAISGRDDRLFPLGFQQALVRERLGIEADVLPGGHLTALAQPVALANQLLAYADDAA
jgi:pimeloyl-ACP methyl ester carboxylesterase